MTDPDRFLQDVFFAGLASSVALIATGENLFFAFSLFFWFLFVVSFGGDIHT